MPREEALAIVADINAHSVIPGMEALRRKDYDTALFKLSMGFVDMGRAECECFTALNVPTETLKDCYNAVLNSEGHHSLIALKWAILEILEKGAG